MLRGVEIIECLDQDDPGSEGRCLKHILNLMEIKSNYSHVSSIDTLLHTITASRFQYIHISTHGITSIEDQFKGWWTPKGIGTRAKVAQINGEVNATAIVSTACKSGSKSFGRYLVDDLGCKYFIGPTGFPKFYNVSLFVHIFYHKLFMTKGRVPNAFKSYNEIYKNPHGFKLYAQSKP
ncbi:MAG: hypothetical protein PHG00_08530 [Methylococcales bacterium]|nr:hypothetical protein [Methylococcales bacterium]